MACHILLRKTASRLGVERVGRRPSCAPPLPRLRFRSVAAVLVLFALLFTPRPAAAQKTTSPHDESLFQMPRYYVCYRVKEPLKIDGQLDEPVWKKAAWTDEFADIEGDKRPRPRFRTNAKMLWDDEYLYVGAYLEEPHVWGTLTKQNSVIFNDNDFEVFIDPNGDNHEYFEFEMNALNTVWNIFLRRPYRNGVKWFNRDQEGQKTGVRVFGTLNDPSDEDEGWSLEIAFPWKAMAEYAHCATPPQDGDQWRLGFSRVEWEIMIEDGKYKKEPGRPEYNWIWSPQGLVDMHRPERWGYVQFSANSPGDLADFRPDPTIPARNLVMRIYYAQEIYRGKHGKFAGDLKDLDVPKVDDRFLARPVALEATDNTFTVTAEIRLRGGQTQKVHVVETSRIWADPPTKE